MWKHHAAALPGTPGRPRHRGSEGGRVGVRMAAALHEGLACQQLAAHVHVFVSNTTELLSEEGNGRHCPPMRRAGPQLDLTGPPAQSLGGGQRARGWEPSPWHPLPGGERLLDPRGRRRVWRRLGQRLGSGGGAPNPVAGFEQCLQRLGLVSSWLDRTLCQLEALGKHRNRLRPPAPQLGGVKQVTCRKPAASLLRKRRLQPRARSCIYPAKLRMRKAPWRACRDPVGWHMPCIL